MLSFRLCGVSRWWNGGVDGGVNIFEKLGSLGMWERGKGRAEDGGRRK